MTGWRPTASLARGAALGSGALVIALAAGRPLLAVLATPFLLHAAIILLARPRPDQAPQALSRLDHATLSEGQSTRLRLRLQAPGAEHAVRALGRSAYLATEPACGGVQSLLPLPDEEALTILVGARRWGRRSLGEEKVALVSPWAGFRHGPSSLGQQSLTVLPVRAVRDSGAPAPHPVGLVGEHRAARPGQGIELGGIRPFVIGDRLRRIHWRHSLRTGSLHTVVADAEEDASVLLLVDALADHGRSGGIDGAASSLDVSVRAAAAVAEHHLRIGDRVGLRLIGGGGAVVPLSSGTAHTHRILGVLARIRSAGLNKRDRERVAMRVPPGTVVVVLSPLLDPHAGDLAVSAVRSGHDVVVIDTMPLDARPVLDEATSRDVGELAWRIRRLDRLPVLHGLSRQGCAVVPWQGPGTLDRVLREMGRRRVRVRR